MVKANALISITMKDLISYSKRRMLFLFKKLIHLIFRCVSEHLINSHSTSYRSFVPPVRDEESETQRKAHAKRVRETRRSTQGKYTFLKVMFRNI